MALVLTSLGKVKGRSVRTKGGKIISSFRAIPYAQPPIGGLRFARPQPVHPWIRTLDGSRNESPSCLQVNVLSPESKLYLGIYLCYN